ncbi:MAG: hypothetical protein IPL58_14025 [Betaproteobacteria bacterium]|uniref:Uncharacterized protein n=1 Tax=Candidatus Proximibacter danicus TaxID=2954365 RepID=A0A9D7K407_9PROT|nr:hypothetical protein [Candidatus Proximibacter danicus]
MNWDTTGHFIVRDLDNQILAAPQQTDGGAAALIFAPGPPLAGQARAASIAGNPCSGDASNTAAAIAAYLDGGYATPAATALSATYVVTAGRANSLVNNDRVAWVTPGEILSRRVKLRQDFQAGINGMLSGVQACLQKHLRRTCPHRHRALFQCQCRPCPQRLRGYPAERQLRR